MRRLLILPIAAFLVIGLALPAMAHNFGGSGDCDGWTLQLDGTWDALEIFVDGSSVGLAQTIAISDGSSNEARQFVVVWDKAPAGPSRSDVTVNHDLERELNCEQPPVVTAECLTVTIDAAEGVEWGIQIGDGFVEGEGTQAFTGSAGQSWAVYYNDQPIASGVFESCTTTTSTSLPPTSSTTVSETTTTSVSESSTTTAEGSTTTSEPLATVTSADSPTGLTELPFTGPSDWLPLAFVALSLGSLGGLLVWSARKDT